MCPDIYTYLLLLAYFPSNGHHGQHVSFLANKQIIFQWISAFLLSFQSLASVFGPGCLLPFHFLLSRSQSDVHVCPDGLPCPLHQHHNTLQKRQLRRLCSRFFQPSERRMFVPFQKRVVGRHLGFVVLMIGKI